MRLRLFRGIATAVLALTAPVRASAQTQTDVPAALDARIRELQAGGGGSY